MVLRKLVSGFLADNSIKKRDGEREREKRGERSAYLRQLANETNKQEQLGALEALSFDAFNN